MAQIFVRVHSPLFFHHFSVHVPVGATSNALHHLTQSSFSQKCPDLSHFITSQSQSSHVECPDSDHFVTFQLRPCHIECPDPGHGTKILCEWGGDCFRHNYI